jgi:membrane protease subunit HflC
MQRSANPNSTRRPLRTVLAFGILPAVLLWLLLSSLFTVDVTEYAAVTRFGRLMRVVPEPGLHLKAPFDRVIGLDRRWTYSRPAPAEYLTVDKRNVVIESVAVWRIGDPERFLATLTSRADADVRLADAVLGEVGAVVGALPVSALIAPDGEPERFEAIASQVRERVASYASAALGIEVVAVQLLHLTLPEQNRTPVFERMQAERGKIAKEYRTAGELLSRRIIAEADREKTRIEAEAYAKAQRLRAEGDAEAGRIYAAAFSRNAAFYKFQRSLKAYEKFLDGQTTLFLPADAEVLRVLRIQPAQAGAAPADGTAVTATSTPRRAEPTAPAARTGEQGAESALTGELSSRTEGAAQ